MKKRILLLFVLALIWSFSSSLADGFRGELSLGEGEDALSVQFVLKTENREVIFHTSFCPDWIFRAEGEMFHLPAGLPVLPEELKDLFLPTWDSWIAVSGMKSETGLFTGDTFSAATERKQLLFSWGDLSLLLNLAEAGEWPESLTGIKAEALGFLRKSLTEAAVRYPGLRFRMDFFEEAGAVSLSAVNGSDTIGTFSARREDNGTVRMILGSAENGKTYFRTLEIPAWEGKRITLEASALADDRGRGYAGLPREALILRERLEAELSDPGYIPFRYSSEKGGTGEAFLSAEGILATGESGFWDLNGEIRYGEDRQPLGKFHLTSDLNAAAQPAEGIRVMDCLNPDPEDLGELTQQIQNRISEWTIRLFQVLPAELILLWM